MVGSPPSSHVQFQTQVQLVRGAAGAVAHAPFQFHTQVHWSGAPEVRVVSSGVAVAAGVDASSLAAVALGGEGELVEAAAAGVVAASLEAVAAGVEAASLGAAAGDGAAGLAAAGAGSVGAGAAGCGAGSLGVAGLGAAAERARSRLPGPRPGRVSAPPRRGSGRRPSA